MRWPESREVMFAAAAWLPAVAAVSAGLAWRDCVLLAGAGLLAVFAFRQGMQRHAPWQGWRAALRCITAGLAMMLAALGLVLNVVGVAAGWWQPGGMHTDSGGLLLLAIASLLVLFRLEHPQGDGQWRAGARASLAAAAAWIAADHGLPYASCAFAAGAALWLVWEGWRLSHDLATELMNADGRR
jgi:hypothetical protein